MNRSVVDTPLGPITIRPAHPGDGPAFRALRLEALRLHPSAFGFDLEEAEALSPEDWEERLGNGERMVMFFAEDEAGALVGMSGVSLGRSSKTRHGAEVVSVYVSPGWRGHHLATALVERCVRWAQDKGAVFVRLGVEAGNPAAIHCYQCLGFEGYALERGALRVAGQDYDFLLMRRDLG